MEEPKETLGKVSTDLMAKANEYDHSANDQMHEQFKDFEKQLDECVESSIKRFPDDFYVVVLTKKERLLKNVIRNYFFGRVSCPTPEYDQIVYKYHRENGLIELLWVIPSKPTCIFMLTNSLSLPSEQKDLLNYVIDFSNETLFRKAKKLNGEEDNSPLLVKG